MLFAAQLAGVALAAVCPGNLANDLRTPAPADARQLITVEAASTQTTYASASIWRRFGACWVRAGGPYPARVGWNGLRLNRREGDGTTPIGSFAIGPTMYGMAPDPGVRFRYTRLRCGDWWVEDPASPVYNTFQRLRCGQRPPFKTPTPDMSKTPTAYVHLAVVEFNMNPVVPGRGSGIFLHAQTGNPTNGCISLRRADLVRVLRWLSPAASPRIVIGTRAGLTRRRS
jgi:L,D-peptidoglycan transpeptidase YkuD (ErfK/YbiS/YcfS/YnhG family)